MYYFIGIKGSGMAALAIMLHDLGKEVIGSDLDRYFFTEDELIKRGIKILPFDPANIKSGYTVIIGNAFLEDFPEVIAARSSENCTCYRYHEYVGKLMEDYTSISIAGSHGKTTTTAMCAQMMSKFKETGYLIGDGEGHLRQDSEYLCVESDEFRRHFLAYHPNYAIINNIEIDHTDYFKDEEDYFAAYQDFVDNVKDAVFYYGDDKECQRLDIKVSSFSYGFSEANDFVATDIIESSEGTNFSLFFKDNFIYNFNLPFVGRHLLIDALGVIALGIVLCFDPAHIESALRYYESPKRRFKVDSIDDITIIDDYAHHPTEVKVTLEAAKKRFDDKRLVAIFKPHRASRVLYFADDFAKALKVADDIYLLEFNSIDDKQDGTDIDISYLKDRIEGSVILSEDALGAKVLAQYHDAALCFMSSKDIYDLEDLVRKELKKR